MDTSKSFVSLVRNLSIESMNLKTDDILERLSYIRDKFHVPSLLFQPARVDNGVAVPITQDDSINFGEGQIFGEIFNVTDANYLVVRVFTLSDDGGVKLTPIAKDANNKLSLMDTKQTSVGESQFFNTDRNRYFCPLLVWEVVQASFIMVHVTNILGTVKDITLEAANL